MGLPAPPATPAENLSRVKMALAEIGYAPGDAFYAHNGHLTFMDRVAPRDVWRACSIAWSGKQLCWEHYRESNENPAQVESARAVCVADGPLVYRCAAVVDE